MCVFGGVKGQGKSSVPESAVFTAQGGGLVEKRAQRASLKLGQGDSLCHLFHRVLSVFQNHHCQSIRHQDIRGLYSSYCHSEYSLSLPTWPFSSSSSLFLLVTLSTQECSVNPGGHWLIPLQTTGSQSSGILPWCRRKACTPAPSRGVSFSLGAKLLCPIYFVQVCMLFFIELSPPQWA